MSNRMSPSEFANVLSYIEVEKVGFIDVHSKLNLEALTDDRITVVGTNEDDVRVEEGERVMYALDKYKLTGTIKGKNVFEIKLSLVAVVTSKKKITEDFRKLFVDNTLKVITYPYVRQAVQDLTSKMGLSPFTMPIWRVPVAGKSSYLRTASSAVEQDASDNTKVLRD